MEIIDFAWLFLPLINGEGYPSAISIHKMIPLDVNDSTGSLCIIPLYHLFTAGLQKALILLLLVFVFIFTYRMLCGIMYFARFENSMN